MKTRWAPASRPNRSQRYRAAAQRQREREARRASGSAQPLPSSVARMAARAPAPNSETEPSTRQRDAAFGRELIGLYVDVPWSAWDGYPVGSGFETGIVWEYHAPARCSAASRTPSCSPPSTRADRLLPARRAPPYRALCRRPLPSPRRRHASVGARRSLISSGGSTTHTHATRDACARDACAT